MDPRITEWADQIMTVHGLVPADDMGVTLPHEHLVLSHQGPLININDPIDAREELERAARYGVRTLVDLTNVGLDRKPAAIRDIAAWTGVQVVMGTGFYKDGWLPSYVHDLSIDEMARFMTSEIIDGAGDTGIHAGVIGEVGVSRNITATEERSLAASARAQRATGAAINLHFDILALQSEYNHALDILDGEGADLSRVVLSHFVCRPDEVELAVQLSGRGPLIEFDLWGMETWTKIVEMNGNTPPEVQIASLRWFIEAGLLRKLLLSQDIGSLNQQHKNGGNGQDHLVRKLLPRFKEFGITDEDLAVMMVENPKRVFPFKAVSR